MSDPTIQESLKVAGTPNTAKLWMAIGRWGRAREGEMAYQASLVVDAQIAELIRTQSESDLALMREVVETLEKWNRNGGVKPGYEFIDSALAALRQRVGGQG